MKTICNRMLDDGGGERKIGGRETRRCEVNEPRSTNV